MTSIRLKSALFVDFDNVYGGLHSLDPSQAASMASEPWEWLKNLLARAQPRVSRDVRVRRAYLNPAGRVANPDGTWTYFSSVRPQLTKSGFEVIDCPSLTAAGKNAADIRIVMDVLDYMAASMRYDEFIVASSDADFTPLLYRLRADDRRTVILAAGQTSVAYREVADSVLDIARLLEDDKLSWPEDAGDVEGEQPPITIVAASDRDGDREQQAVVESALSSVQSRDEPILLSTFALELRTAHGPLQGFDNWFGHGTFGKFLLAANPGLVIEGHYVRDPGRHGSVGDDGSTVPDLIHRVCKLTDLPRMRSDEWSLLFGTLARYASENDFSLTHCTAWCRDELQAAGHSIGRGQVSYAVRAALYGGQSLGSIPPPTAEEIREAVLQSTIVRCRSLGLNLSETEEEVLRAWLADRDATNTSE